MLSAGLYVTPNVFARVIHASAEPFLGGLQFLIRRINLIVQTGPPPISTIFACSNWCIYSSEPSAHPICDYGELSCLGPELSAPLRPLVPTIPSFDHYSATFLPISDSYFSRSLHFGTYASYALHSYIYMPPLPPMFLPFSSDDPDDPQDPRTTFLRTFTTIWFTFFRF